MAFFPLMDPYIADAAPAPNEMVLMYGFTCCAGCGGVLVERDLDMACFAMGEDMAVTVYGCIRVGGKEAG